MIQKVLIVLLLAVVYSACSSPKGTPKQTAMNKTPIVENISPGTAIVQFKVLKEEATTQDSISNFYIEILNVERYGSATPILSQGEELIVAFSNNDVLAVGEKYLGVFKHSKNLVQANNKPNWTLDQIK
ncbi:MAG: hypothetical protein WC967_04660 [Balneolaceae bacterium]